MAKMAVYDSLTGETIIIDVEEVVDETFVKDLKEVKLLELMSIYKTSITSGFKSSATGVEVIYGYKEQDQLNYSKIANLFALNPSKTSTIIGSDSHGVVTLSKEQFLVFMEDAEAYEMNMYIKRKEIEAQINSATTVEELNSIIVSFE